VTEQTQLTRDWHTLTHKDVTLYIQFYQLCKRDGKTQFTSDDFRNYGLHEQFNDTQHEIGILFAKLKWHRLIVEIGRKRSTIPSNHNRRNSVFKFKMAEGETDA